MMANASAMSLPRINKSVPIYGSSEDSVVLRLSNDFDDIIEKIESLRLTRNREVGNQPNSLIDLFDRQTRDSNKCERSGAIIQKCRIEESTENGNDEGKRDNDKDSGDSKDVSSENTDNDNHLDQEEERLLERGPIKSQLPSANRESPYWPITRTPTFKMNEKFGFDYETTAEQILRDEEYNEKLNACMDQLPDTVRTDCNSWSDGEDQSAFNVYNFNNFAFTSANVDDPSEDTLLEILSSGVLQPAQCFSRNKFLSSQDATNGRQESHVLSGSESRGSSPTCSIASAVCGESPRTMRTNFIYNSVNSPQISTTTYRPQQISSSSSNSPYSFSPSSNLSYTNSPSPNASHQVPIASHLGERLDEDIENSLFWNSGPSKGELAETNKAAGNTDTVGNIVDSIDNNELQLLEEVLRDLGEDVSATKNAANLLPYANEIARQECLQESSSVEQYLSRVEGANSNNRSNCNGIVANSLAATVVSKSNVSHQTHRTVPDNTVPRIVITEPIPADAIVPNSVNNNGSPAAQKCNFAAEQKTNNAYNNTRQTFEYPSLFPNSPEFFLSPSNAAPINTNNVQIPPSERRRMRRLGSPHSQRRRNSDRNIMPWPSFNLPSVRASERLKEGLDPREVEKAMSNLLKRSVDDLAKQDEDGDTLLMCLVGNPDELAKKRAYLVPLVERLSTVKGALSVMNDRGEDALYLAAINCPQFSYVTGYLAASMLQKGIDVSQRLYHTRGDTLIHSLATQGDTHGEVLAELLALKTVQGNPVFDLSKRNYDGRTALHVAIEAHDPATRGISSVATVKLLLKYGADPKIKETKCGDTALHMAVSLGCDPALVKVLLATQASNLVNATNYNQNTPLHLAAVVSNSVPLERQREVCWLLTQTGGQTNISNRQGKTPLALVSAERKDAIRRVFYKRS